MRVFEISYRKWENRPAYEAVSQSFVGRLEWRLGDEEKKSVQAETIKEACSKLRAALPSYEVEISTFRLLAVIEI